MDCMDFNAVSTVFQLHRGGYPCFPGVLSTSIPRKILSKPLDAFPHNHYRSNGESERGMNPVAMTERIMDEATIEPAISCSQVMCATD